VRIGLIAAVVLGAGAIIPVYFIAGWIADDQPREVADETKDQRKFWQGVRASPSQSARDIRGRMREIDRRLADIEQFVTTENRSLAREIEELR
jgi:phage shock protein C